MVILILEVLRMKTSKIGVEILDHIAIDLGIPIAETQVILHQMILLMNHQIRIAMIIALEQEDHECTAFKGLAHLGNRLRFDELGVPAMNFGKFRTGTAMTRRGLPANLNMYETYINTIIV